MKWTQLEPGILLTEQRLINLGQIVLGRQRHGGAFRSEGIVRSGTALFAFTGGSAKATRWNGVEVTNEDVATTRERVDVVSSAADTLYTALLHDDALRERGIPSCVSDTLQGIPRSPSLVRSPQVKHLRAYVEGVLDVKVRPGRLSRTTVSANLLWFLAAAVGEDGQAIEPSRPHSRRIAAVERCREYIDARMGEAVTLLDLSAVSGLQPRSLINAFEAVMGTSPMAYLRARRLGSVRDVLESQNSPKARIIDVAADCGFWHMGHFTTAYRAMFGETPSETLCRGPK